MRHRLLDTVFIFVLLGGFTTIAQKSGSNDKHGDSGMFFIDDPQGDSIEGSAVEDEFHDLEHSSGKGVDDEDAPDGSGSGPIENTDEAGSGDPSSKVGIPFHTEGGPPPTGSSSTTTTTVTTVTSKKPSEIEGKIVPKHQPGHENQIPDDVNHETTTKKLSETGKSSPTEPTVLGAPGSEGEKDHKAKSNNDEDNQPSIMQQKSNERYPFFARPGILAAVVGGAVVGLLCAILLVMFIVYRMRKKDEGSYALDEPKRSPTVNSYTRSSNKEFYA